MTSRTSLGVVSALALSLAGVPAAQADPLAGKGQNIQAISTIEIDDSQKNELELAGDYAYVNHDEGIDIVNIADPANPKITGEWKCKGGWGDIDISPDAKIAVVPKAHPGTPCAGGGTAATIVDISDKKNPRILSKIDLEKSPVPIVGDYVHTVTLDGKWLYLNPQIFAGYPQYKQRIRVFDVSNPAAPVEKGAVQFTQGVQSVAHDSFIDHRPDGKSLLYAASIHTTDVFDVTNPMAAQEKQRITSPEMTISHQAQPNFDRKMILIADESAADTPAGATCGHAGSGPASADVGSIHFYAAAADGTFANNGAAELGSWAPPPTRTDGSCTAHVFWPAPDQNRLTQAWYRQGARILDFSDPANVKELGSFVADKPTMYWSVKPHRGYLFATDMDRGLDILRYTGEGGTKWPTTAGPAEIQRSQWQGVPYTPLTGAGSSTKPLPAPPAPSGTSGSAGSQGGGSAGQRGGASIAERALGRFSFTTKVRRLARGKRNVLHVTFFTPKGKRLGSRVRFIKKGGRRTTKVTVSGIAVPGKYRWVITKGKRTLKRGTLTVRQGRNLTLSPKHTIYAKAR